MPYPTLVSSLISHQWKQTTRSAYFEKGILIRIFIGLMLLYLVINLVVIGLFMGKIISEAFPDDEVAWAFSRILFYYFIADFVLRFFVQPLPVLTIMPYLHLPVKRTKLFNFLLAKSALSLFNFMPLLILLPFTLKSVLPGSEGGFALSWLLTVILLVFANNFLAFIVKKVYLLKPLILFAVLAAAALLILADVKTSYLISRGFASAITGIAQHVYLLLIPLTLLVVIYLASWFFLYKNRYIEPGMKKEKLLFSGNESRSFDSFGIPGRLVMMEIKLILRNKRPRSFLILSAMFMFYGFMIYPPHRQAGTGMYLFAGLLLTGIFIMQYGQLIMSWESRSFDQICTSGLRMHDYFRGKFWFFIATNIISFLLTLPYAFYDSRIALVNLAAFLYNSGINIFIILFLGTYNTRRIDLGKGAMFNYEGTSFIHFVLIIPLIGLPYLIWMLFLVLGHPDMGFAAIGLAGAAGLLFSEVLIRSTVKQFNSRKYKILNGFRTT
ncbi:MAG: DUF5687 family protein [Bacteroidetes bacterium]|nr:DUF5687 family protein [Bacteroidota bacterium]